MSVAEGTRGVSVIGLCVCAFLDNLACYAECCGETLRAGDEEIALNLANEAHASHFAIETEYVRGGSERASLVPVGEPYDAERARVRLGIGQRRTMRRRDQLRRAKHYHRSRDAFREQYRVWRIARGEYSRIRRRMKRSKKVYAAARRRVRKEWR